MGRYKKATLSNICTRIVKAAPEVGVRDGRCKTLADQDKVPCDHSLTQWWPGDKKKGDTYGQKEK